MREIARVEAAELELNGVVTLPPGSPMLTMSGGC
jgi:hypothetical protein